MQENNTDSGANLTMQTPEKNPESFTYVPIGTVHSPFTDIAGMPIQPTGVTVTPLR